MSLIDTTAVADCGRSEPARSDWPNTAASADPLAA